MEGLSSSCKMNSINLNRDFCTTENDQMTTPLEGIIPARAQKGGLLARRAAAAAGNGQPSKFAQFRQKLLTSGK